MKRVRHRNGTRRAHRALRTATLEFECGMRSDCPSEIVVSTSDDTMLLGRASDGGLWLVDDDGRWLHYGKER